MVVILLAFPSDEISYEMLRTLGLPVREKTIKTEEAPAVEEKPAEEVDSNEENNG